MSEFKPGDVIERTYDNGATYRYIVQKPAYTKLGKVRVKGERATTVTTAWWKPESMPPGYVCKSEDSP